MKKNLLAIAGMIFSGIVYSQITYTTASTPVTCAGGNDGTASITSISGGVNFNTSTKGLLISEILTDPTGSDSPFEFVELVATRYINFATTPYTVIFSNNFSATANGWINGGTRTYAFSITSGTALPGSVVYVGGSSMIPLTNQVRVINTGTTAGDGGIGNAVAGGVLGNGGASADGIAVFSGAIGSITAATVPIDAIFFGDAIGSAYLSSSQGYELPINDVYSGGKLDTTDYFVQLPATMTDKYIKANFGVYNTTSNIFSYPRTWTVTNTFTNLSTSILIDGLYNVSWSNSCTSVYNPNLTAGTYSFTIFDQLATMATGSVVVADGFVLNLNMSTPDTLACTGDLLAFTAANADTYLWSTGGSSTTEYVTVTGDTTIYLTGTDTIAGCSVTDSIFIDVNAYPVVNFSMTNDTICNDGGNIILSATPIGGNFTGTGVSGGILDPSALSGANSATYTYTDGNGCSDNQTANYFVVNCVGIEDENTFVPHVFPNPATEYIRIDNTSANTSYIIIDLSGRVVSSGKLNSGGIISVENFTNGIYILQLSDKGQTGRIKFIKH
jgi:hypothetical protein